MSDDPFRNSAAIHSLHVLLLFTVALNIFLYGECTKIVFLRIFWQVKLFSILKSAFLQLQSHLDLILQNHTSKFI